MEKINFNSLNEQQLNAMREINGAVLVTAGAGSGKTRLLTHRICYLIEEFGVDPYNILAITFTNKAANEMRERIEQMMPNLGNIWISTFHSMCVRILRNNISDLDARFDRNFSIYADAESEKVLKAIINQKNIKDDKFLKQVRFHISNRKNENMTYEEYLQENSYVHNIKEIMEVMREYQQVLISSNALDFDDLLICVHALFKTRPEILSSYTRRFKYILVDEFQDTNTIQYELVKMLASEHKNVFAVGDEDQCIYTWRGANFKNIFNFKKDFEGCKFFKLERNYRSTKVILDCANKLIKHNNKRVDKTLWSDIEGGSPVEYHEVYDEQAEAEFIAKTIHKLVSEEGYSYKDFALLMRLNALSMQLEQSLLSYNIPHKIYGGFKFFERAEIKNILAYLKLFVNPKDDQAFLRVINFPKRGIGDTTIEKLKDYSQKCHNSLLETCLDINNTDLATGVKTKISLFCSIYKRMFELYDSMKFDEFAKEIIDAFGIRQAYASKSEEDTDKLLNIDQLLLSMKTFAEKNPDGDLSDYLQSVLLISDIDTMDEDNNVIVATVHAVKGLEFRCVFIVGLEEKIFPISRAYDSDDDMEEERRLMYVAITRAKQRLFMTNCQTRYLYGRRDYMLPSRFIENAGLSKKRKFVEKPINSTASRTVNSQVDYVKASLSNDNKTAYQQFMANKKTKVDVSQFKAGAKVLHTTYGIGVIKSVDLDDEIADIEFNNFGVKTLMLQIAPLKIIE